MRARIHLVCVLYSEKQWLILAQIKDTLNTMSYFWFHNYYCTLMTLLHRYFKIQIQNESVTFYEPCSYFVKGRQRKHFTLLTYYNFLHLNLFIFYSVFNYMWGRKTPSKCGITVPGTKISHSLFQPYRSRRRTRARRYLGNNITWSPESASLITWTSRK